MSALQRLEPALALRLITQALGGRVSIPLSAVRDRIADLSDKVAIDIAAESPGIRVEGEAQALGAPVVFSARVEADGIHVQGLQRSLRIHLTDVTLTTTEDAPGPLADAIRNGMIDTKNPATLIGNMVSLPEMIVSAEGQDVLIDLMRFPALDRDERLKSAVAAASSYVCVTGIQVSDDAIELQLGLLPGGLKEAALSTARAVLAPAVRFLWPEGTKR
jgi:hypothetical protein